MSQNSVEFHVLASRREPCLKLLCTFSAICFTSSTLAYLLQDLPTHSRPDQPGPRPAMTVLTVLLGPLEEFHFRLPPGPNSAELELDEPEALCLIPDTTNGTAIYADQLGWFGGSTDRQSYGSPICRVWEWRRVRIPVRFLSDASTSTIFPSSPVGRAAVPGGDHGSAGGDFSSSPYSARTWACYGCVWMCCLVPGSNILYVRPCS